MFCPLLKGDCVKNACAWSKLKRTKFLLNWAQYGSIYKNLANKHLKKKGGNLGALLAKELKDRI